MSFLQLADGDSDADTRSSNLSSLVFLLDLADAGRMVMTGRRVQALLSVMTDAVVLKVLLLRLWVCQRTAVKLAKLLHRVYFAEDATEAAN